MDENFLVSSELTEEQAREQALRVVQAKAFSSGNLAPHEFKRYDCEECEDDLPLLRMQKGFCLCTLCQTKKERKGSR